MTGKTELDARLDRLAATVAKVSAERKEARRKAWAVLSAAHPDCAEVIRLVSEAFGRPERVRVKEKGKIILDSKAINRGV